MLCSYLDIVGDMTAGLYGHSHPKILSAIHSALSERGLSLGGQSPYEIDLADLICDRFPSIDVLRFCNSGTEANLYAIAAARHNVNKQKVLVFEGAYHGGVLTFTDQPAEGNVDQRDWVIGKYNDIEGTKRLIRNTADLAAVLVEGMQGAGGCFPGDERFLLTIQEECRTVRYSYYQG